MHPVCKDSCKLSFEKFAPGKILLALRLVPYLEAVLARFQVLTVATANIADFCAVVPCSPVDVYRRFRGACFYQSAWRNKPEDSHLQNLPCPF
jgi:hypothetical protein